jgi:hypothetical protein
MEECYLKDIKFEGGDFVLEWPYIELGDFFIFYKPIGLDKNDPFCTGEPEQLGFVFMSIEIVGQQVGEPILYPQNYVEILYWGYAYFDGMRHMYLGDNQTDNYGYINYPHIKNHIKLLATIRELEEKYCRDIYR